MRPPEQLDTARLRLRQAHVDDAQALFDTYTSDPHTTRYLSWRTHESVDQTIEFLTDATARWNDGTEFVWVLVLRGDDRPIGAIGAANTAHGVEIGYVVGRPWWGRGFASEALGALMAWLRTQPDVYRIWAYCAVDHHKSARVLEGSGMTYEGTLRRWVVLPNIAAEPCDCRVYSWIRTES